MIKSFKNKLTEAIYHGLSVKQMDPRIVERARLKLDVINAATYVQDLMSPPGNKLEALKGDRLGQLSMRINDQWRICFKFHNGDAYDVEILDYH
jgi:proteic killer suppression protein